MIGRIIIGIIMLGVGFLFVWKTDIPMGLIGQLQLGRFFSGGSRFLYKLIGIIIIFIGVLAITNLHNEFIAATLGSFLF